MPTVRQRFRQTTDRQKDGRTDVQRVISVTVSTLPYPRRECIGPIPRVNSAMVNTKSCLCSHLRLFLSLFSLSSRELSLAAGTVDNDDLSSD